MQEEDTVLFATETAAGDPRNEEIPGPTTRPVPTANIGSDMMAVARRIQERARVLSKERRLVEETDAVLVDLRVRREREQAINDRRRQHMLERVNERNEIELELFRVRDSIRDHRERARATERDTLASEENTEALTEGRVRKTKSVYGPNLARMESFIHILTAKVESRERASKKRRERLEGLRAELADSRKEEEDIIRETAEIREAMDRAHGNCAGSTGASEAIEGAGSGGNKNNGFGREEEEITTLSGRVREVIEQVGALSAPLVCFVSVSICAIHQLCYIVEVAVIMFYLVSIRNLFQHDSCFFFL